MDVRKYYAVAAAAAAVAALTLPLTINSASAATASCQVSYTDANDWGNGYTADFTITDTGTAPLTNWTLTYANTGNQTLVNGWNGSWSQSGAAVTVTAPSFQTTIAAGSSYTTAANFNYSGSNSAPANYAVNGIVCNLTGTPSPTATSATPTPSVSTPPPPPTSSSASPPTSSSSSPLPTGDLALGRPATSSSDESASLSAANAVDGNSATRWSSAYSDPQWIQIDLGSAQPISYVMLHWEAAYATKYQIQISNDATTWTTLYSTTNGTGGVSELPVSGSGRYVRLYATARANTQWGYSLYEFAVYSIPPAQPSCDQTPADANADSKARNLLCYLKTHAYVSGQTDTGDADTVKTLTGRYPAIVAFDFMNYTQGDIETQSVIDWYNSHHGIVAFQWHWYCPYGGNYAADCNFTPDLNNPSSKLYSDIDLICTQLKTLGNAGVPVLFRPLHESNNNYMWWTKQGSDSYKRLWQLIFQRCQLAGVHNVVWVFNGMASGQSTPLSQWYPGDGYADLVTSDYYQSWNDFSTATSVGTDKTVGVAETFSPLNPASEPAWPYFVVWASRDWASSGKDVAGLWKTAMANPQTISIDQLPDMTKW